jgi:hypothetical protein
MGNLRGYKRIGTKRGKLFDKDQAQFAYDRGWDMSTSYYRGVNTDANGKLKIGRRIIPLPKTEPR